MATKYLLAITANSLSNLHLTNKLDYDYDYDYVHTHTCTHTHMRIHTYGHRPVTPADIYIEH